MPSSQTFSIKFNPNPIQRAFIESRAKADLFSSRAGEGKSTALAWSIFYHARHNPGANWAVLRDTFENIQRTTLKTFFEWFPPGIAGSYAVQKKEWTWASGLASGTVTFMGMDDATDTSKLLSWELAGIAMDEPAPAYGSAGMDSMVFDLGLTRLRQPGMKWYGMKLATNNPDEAHWTYQRFGSGEWPEYRLWQPTTPENVRNLPSDYYENMRRTLQSRPDLIRRFVDGEFGFQAEGLAVTPQWNDYIHLATGLSATKGRELYLLWDFGHNPTCIITQKTPMGHWLILYSLVGTGIGVVELIEDAVKPLLAQRFRGHPLHHIGDPAGATGEQTSVYRSAVQAIKRSLGGTWRPGPVKTSERVDPLRAVLTRTVGGRGVVQVDRINAKEVWHALRGGWHYHVAKTGVTSADPKKNIHSHPGDAMGYGAAILFPIKKLVGPQRGLVAPTPEEAAYFGKGVPDALSEWRIGKQPATVPPPHGTSWKGSFDG